MTFDFARERSPRRASGRTACSVLRPSALALVCAAALFAMPASVLAHARLSRSLPADGAALPAAPVAIELWFNELLDDEFNSVAVFRAGPDGAPADARDLAGGPPHVDAADRTHLTVSVRPLAPGAYVAQWKVLSRDGHSARGRVRFTVGAG